MLSPRSALTCERNCLVSVFIAVMIQSTLACLIAGPRLRVGLEDTDLFYRHVAPIWQGRVPYRDYPVEYPPLALPLFLIPAAVSRDVREFKLAFAGEMLLFNALTVWSVALWVNRRAGPAAVPGRLIWYTLFFLILSRLIVTKYDAAPMLVGFAAALSWAGGRTARGGAVAAVGALTKVYPVVVAVVGVVADQRRCGSARGRGALAFTLVAVVGVAGWMGCCGVSGVANSIHFQSGRGFEYGSLPSGAQMLAAKLLGEEIVIARDHSSFSLTTRWSEPLLRLVLPVQAVTLLAVCWVFARRGSPDVVRASSAAVLGFIATGKVFSPQYLIWLIPFVAVLEGPLARRGCWLFAAICATTLLAPALLNALPRTSFWVILAYNGRNLLVVALWVLLVFGAETARENPEVAVGRWSDRRSSPLAVK